MPSKFIRKRIKIYKNLDPCYCPALDETVHFTANGLNHILYKRRRPRSHDEKHYRAGLIPHIVTVIKNARRAVKSIEESGSKNLTTWVLEHEDRVNGEQKIVKVILRKEGAGKVKFLSVMSR